MSNNWWIFDRGDIFTLMVNDYYISTFISKKDAELFAREFNVKIDKGKEVK